MDLVVIGEPDHRTIHRVQQSGAEKRLEGLGGEAGGDADDEATPSGRVGGLQVIAPPLAGGVARGLDHLLDLLGTEVRRRRRPWREAPSEQLRSSASA